MKFTVTLLFFFALFVALALFSCLSAEPSKSIELWPNGAPGEKGGLGEELDMTKPTDGLIAGRPVIRLGNVSKPAMSVYRPPADKDTGAAVVVCPGGGYHILALDLEGRRCAIGSIPSGSPACC